MTEPSTVRRPYKSVTTALAAALALLSAAASDAQDFRTCVSGIGAQAVSNGLSRDAVTAALANARALPDVIRLDRNQPESRLSFQSYVDRLLTPVRVERGRAMLAEHGAAIREAAAGRVEAELLVAFWGLETAYGRVMGNHDSLNSLLTLACDHRRPAFFRREALGLLELLARGRLGPERPTGSWAGAMGHLQFLPSVLLRHGEDLDGDGLLQIRQPGPDLFATAAAFLQASGWQAGSGWGVELAPAGVACEHRCRLTPAMREGLKTLDGRALPERSDATWLVRFDDGKRAFLLMPNFEALLRWNRSDSYAVTVGLLFDQLRGGEAFATGRLK